MSSWPLTAKGDSQKKNGTYHKTSSSDRSHCWTSSVHSRTDSTRAPFFSARTGGSSSEARWPKRRETKSSSKRRACRTGIGSSCWFSSHRSCRGTNRAVWNTNSYRKSSSGYCLSFSSDTITPIFKLILNGRLQSKVAFLLTLLKRLWGQILRNFNEFWCRKSHKKFKRNRNFI